MPAALLACLLAALPAAAAPEDAPNVSDLGIRDDEPHLRHRFIAANGRRTEIRTRLSDLAAAGFTADRTPAGVRLRRDDKEWVGDEGTLLVAQWFHTRLHIANQRDLIAEDPRYEVVHTYYPNYPSLKDPVTMAATVRDLAKAGLRPDFLDSGEPVLIDRSGRTLRGQEWAMAVADAWYAGTGAERARRSKMLGKMAAGFAAAASGAGGDAGRAGAQSEAAATAPPAGAPASPADPAWRPARAATATAAVRESAPSSASTQGEPRRPRALSTELFGLTPAASSGARASAVSAEAGSAAARTVRDVPVPDFDRPGDPSSHGASAAGGGPASAVRAWFAPGSPLGARAFLTLAALLALAAYLLSCGAAR